MTYRAKNRLINALLITVLLLAFSSLTIVGAAGYAGTFKGRSAYEGYFTGVKDMGGSHVIDAYQDYDDALPEDFDSVSELMVYLRKYDASGTPQQKIGAAFIVNTMLGRTGQKARTDLNANNPEYNTSDFIEVEKRLYARAAAGRIEWDAIVTNAPLNYNSYYQGTNGSGGAGQSNPNDDAFYKENKIASGIYIRDDSGNVIYTLIRHCANPVGDLKGLPSADWSITVNTSVTKTTAKVGDKIIWTHTVDVKAKIDRDVTYNYVNGSTFLAGLPAPVVTLSSGYEPNIITFTSSYDIVTADIGRSDICRATRASSTSKDNNTPITSSFACVSVLDPSGKDDCRPQIVKVSPVVYPNVSHTDPNNKPYNSGVQTIPVEVHVDGVLFGTYDTTTTVDITKKYTDGNNHNITFKESVRHISGYNDEYKNGAEILQYVPGTPEVPEVPESKGCVWCSPIIPASPAIPAIPAGPGSWESKTPPEYKQIYVKTEAIYSGPDYISNLSYTTKPCYDYELTPSVSSPSFYAVESGTSVNFNVNVKSDSWTKNNMQSFYLANNTFTKSKATNWQVSRLVFRPGVSSVGIASGTSYTEPCSYYRNVAGSPSCVSVGAGSGTVFSNNLNPSVVGGSSLPTSMPVIIDDLEVGTKVCFALSVKADSSEQFHYSHTPNNVWSHSAVDFTANQSCIIIAKKPKVQIWGGDLSVGRSTGLSNVQTSTSVKIIDGVSRTFGSWVEYGIYASGSISGTASGSAFSVFGMANAQICGYSLLSFTNAGNSSCSATSPKGYYTNTRSMPDIASSFLGAGVTVSSSSISADSYFSNSGVNVATRNGNLTLNSSRLSAGKSIVLKVNGTVNIVDNQFYDDDNNSLGYTNISQLPQLIIIADNINIASNVNQVDAWLIAKNGSINTCYDAPASLTSNLCTSNLIVNGPVMARRLYMNRTAGSGVGSESGDPAEVFNLRSDAYLWAYYNATSSGRVQTVYSNELPPRF